MLFPVALEIDHAQLAASSCPSIGDTNSAYLMLPGRSRAGTKRRCPRLPSRPTLHFRSESDRDEHTAREYARLLQTPAVVLPSLFHGGSVSVEALREFLVGLPDTATGFLGAVLEQGDRTSGANSLMLRAAPADVGALKQLMRVVVGKPAPKKPGTKGPLPYWLSSTYFEARSSSRRTQTSLFSATCARCFAELTANLRGELPRYSRSSKMKRIGVGCRSRSLPRSRRTFDP